MKKIISILIMSMCLFSAGVQAQVTFDHTHTSPTGVIVNAGRVDTMDVTITASSNVHGITWGYNRNSGTLSSGTMILSGTVDGTHYDDIDTLTVTNVAVKWVTKKYEEPIWTKYRVISSVAGATSNVTTFASAVGRKYYK